MYIERVITFSFVFLTLSFIRPCAPGRVYFSKCGLGGFTCIVNNGKYRITYQCPSTEKDVTFYLWQFRSPSNTEAVTVRNCTTFRLSFLCTGENKPINHLLVANVTNLFIIKSLFVHNPETITFQNIANLQYIPENTFSQIKRRLPVGGCINPIRDFQNLHFSRVNIGTIAPKAFNELKDFHNFSWSEVRVQRLQHFSVDLEFNSGGDFSVRKSNLEVCEHLAFKITGPRAIFAETGFVDVFSGAINGTIGNFTFTINTVNNLQAYGFSILAETVRIVDNKFEYLKSGAFEKISPGLLQNSRRNFGSLRFVYEFSHNSIAMMDSGCLNPDMQAYENVATDLIFSRNGLFCSCENIGWLFVEVGHGHNFGSLQDFYDTIIDEEFKNVCSYTSCGLPLHEARNLTQRGKCLENRTAENLCAKEERRMGAKTVAVVAKHKFIKTANKGVRNENFDLLMIVTVINLMLLSYLCNL